MQTLLTIAKFGASFAKREGIVFDLKLKTTKTANAGSLGTIGGTAAWATGSAYPLIDGLGRWNRALTADERTRLWNGGNGRTLP